MNYQDAVAYLEDVQKKRPVNPGLKRMQRMAERMGHPERKLRIIHIAGTNGKGSVGAYIANALAMSGYSVGRFVSPALFGMREQIQRISGTNFGTETEWITEGEMAARMTELADLVQYMELAGEELPTSYELQTGMAFAQMARWHVDVAVVETGMGGAEDATNIVEKPVLTVFSRISMDHMAYLGNTLEEIAACKFGIIKAGVPVVSVRQEFSVMEQLREICQQRGLKLRIAEPEQISQQDFSLERTVFRYRGEVLQLRQLGVYQAENAIIAWEALRMLAESGFHKLNISSVRMAFRTTRWPGRFALLSRDPFLILDGAHNPNGAAALKSSLETYFPAQRFIYIFGVFRDKDYSGILDVMLPLAEQVYTVRAQGERGMDPGILCRAVQEKAQKFQRQLPVSSCQSIPEALSKIATLHRQQKTVIFGSLSFLHEVYQFFDADTYI